MKKIKFTLLMFILLVFFNCNSDDSFEGNQEIISQGYCKPYLIEFYPYKYVIDYNISNEIHINVSNIPFDSNYQKIILKFEEGVLKQRDAYYMYTDEFVLESKIFYTSENKKITKAEEYLYNSEDDSFDLSGTYVYSYDGQGRVNSEIHYFENDINSNPITTTYDWSGNNLTKVSVIEESFGYVRPLFEITFEYDMEYKNKLIKALPYFNFFMTFYSIGYGEYYFMSENVVQSLSGTMYSPSGQQNEWGYQFTFTYDENDYFTILEYLTTHQLHREGQFYWNCD